MIIQLFVLIEVKVCDHAIEIFGFQLAETVLTLKLAQRLSIYKTDIGSIYSFEGRVGLKLSHSA